MSSSRFPGKVLAPLCGRPVIAHVVSRLREVADMDKVILVTSTDQSDDPLAAYGDACLGVDVYRGDLHNVVARFQGCLRKSPCEWFIRISGDSPVIDPRLVEAIWRRADDGYDLVTNVRERTFPPGQSVEVVKTSAFVELDAAALAPDEQEHATLHFYRHPERYRIRSMRSVDTSLAQRRLVVDCVDDLRRMEGLLTDEPRLTTGYDVFAEAPH